MINSRPRYCLLYPNEGLAADPRDDHRRGRGGGREGDDRPRERDNDSSVERSRPTAARNRRVSRPGEERCREREPWVKSGGGRAGKRRRRDSRGGIAWEAEDGEGRIGRQGRVGKVTVRQSGCGAGIRGSVIIYLGGQVPGGL